MADSPRARRRPRPSASLLRFLLGRAAALVLLAVGITLVVFVLTQLVPSNAVATNLGEQAAGDPTAVAAFKAHY
jgi:ABC-type dipeptide/oligopeptide/nickel transport system permease component